MYARIRAATLPARQAVQAEERSVLPRRGGFNEWIASARPSHSTLIGPRSAGVVIRQRRKGHDFYSLNRGRLRHPLYGNREHWYDQTIPAGWFERPLTAMAPEVRAACQIAMHDTAIAAGFHDLGGL